MTFEGREIALRGSGGILQGMDLSTAALSVMTSPQMVALTTEVMKRIEGWFLDKGERAGEELSRDVDCAEKLAPAKLRYEQEIEMLLQLCMDTVKYFWLAKNAADRCDGIALAAEFEIFRHHMVPIAARLIARFIEKCEANYENIFYYGGIVAAIGAVAGVVGAAIWAANRRNDSSDAQRGARK
ncbi:unnamed protein product, partial [Mesorhabditis spiculigera]